MSKRLGLAALAALFVFSRAANATCYVNPLGKADKLICTPTSSGGGGTNQVRGYQTVSFSATPTFTASTNNAFAITLTGNVTSSTFSSPNTGQSYTFIICQDGTGGRTFAWPTGFSLAPVIDSTASACTAQEFVWDGTNAKPSGPPVVTGIAGSQITLFGSSSGSQTVVPPATAAGVITTPSATGTLARKHVDDINESVFCLDAGANDTYACNLTPAPAAYVTGNHYRFKANTANTGAASINFNSLGAKTIVKVAGSITTTLADNDILAGQWVELVYDGTNMQMLSLLGNAPSGGSATWKETFRAFARNTGVGYATQIDSGCTGVGGTNPFHVLTLSESAGVADCEALGSVPLYGFTSAGAVTVTMFLTGASAATYGVAVDTVCTADGDGTTALGTFNTASTSTVTFGATNTLKVLTITGVVTTGCSDGKLFNIRIKRNTDTPTDALYLQSFLVRQ